VVLLFSRRAASARGALARLLGPVQRNQTTRDAYTPCGDCWWRGNPMGLPLHRTRRRCAPVMWSDVVFTHRGCRLRPEQIPGTSACLQRKQIQRSLRQTLVWSAAPRLFAFNFEGAAFHLARSDAVDARPRKNRVRIVPSPSTRPNSLNAKKGINVTKVIRHLA